MAAAYGQKTIDAGTTPREILMGDVGALVIPGPCLLASTSIDGSNTGRTDEIRAGTLLAQLTAAPRLWVPYKRTTVLTTGTYTALPVTNAALFKVGDIISIGADETITVTAINYTTNILTIASTAVVAADAVFVTAANGSETCRGILKQSVRTTSMVPRDTDVYDVPIVVLVAGYVNVDMVIGDLAAARADTASQLTGFLWSDRQGN